MIKTYKLSKEAWNRMRKDRIKEILDSRWENIKLLRNKSDEIIDSQWFYINEDYINSFNAYEQHIGKYIRLHYLENTFANGLLFQEPSQWNDDFERRFYEADYSNITDNNENFTPKLYACCFTYGFETEAAWKTYAGRKKDEKDVVRLEINKKRLLSELNNWAKHNKYTVYIGYANYKYPLHLLKTIHKANERENSLWFEDFSLKNYLTLLLQKRQAYYNEMEERFFLIPDDKTIPVKKNLCVKLSFEKIVDKIILCPDFQSEKENKIREMCIKHGISCIVQRSELNTKKTIVGGKITIEKTDDDNPWKFNNLR